MRKSVEITIQDLNPITKAFEKEETSIIINPFKNQYEFLKKFISLATDSSLEELEKFAFCGSLSYHDGGGPFSRYNLLQLQWGKSSEEWYEKDISTLINHKIFEECKKDTKYYDIENYIIGKAELRVLRKLPKYEVDIKTIWLSGAYDYIDWYFECDFPMQKILAEAYEYFGWEWFSCGAPEDPSYYAHAVFAALSANKYGSKSTKKTIKDDLFEIYDTCLLALSSKENFFNKYSYIKEIKEIKNAIDQIDFDKQKELANKIESLRDSNFKLSKDIEVLKKSLKHLKNSIEIIQNRYKKSENKDDSYELINKICTKTETLVGNMNFDTILSKLQIESAFVKNFEEDSKKDLITSFVLKNNYISFDLALLPLLRSLEREIINNIFIPFWNSNVYKIISDEELNLLPQKYSIEVKCIRHTGGKPTLGSLPFIGRCLKRNTAIYYLQKSLKTLPYS